jgi:hypothetical protein
LKCSSANIRKFSSTTLVEFLSNTLQVLPESELRESFQEYLEEIEALTTEAEITTPSKPDTQQKKPQKHALTSEFEIQARPGMRKTRVSQKLRQEKDRANMTSEDEDYTRLVECINDHLKEIFTYNSILLN